MNLADIQKRVLASSLKKYLLDLYPNAAAAYSLRKLRSGYTGNCIEVRRSSDNTTQNIGFVNDVLDTASLLSFVGAGNGFVRTWYDQSGNGRNATQTINLRQPRIMLNGTIDTLNGKPVVRNPDNNVFRGLLTNLSNLQPLPVTLIYAGKLDALSSNVFANFSTYFGGSVNAGDGSRYAFFANNDGFYANNRGAGVLLTKSLPDFNPFIQQGNFRTSGINGRQNGVDSGPAIYSGSPFNTASNFQLISPGFDANNSTVNPSLRAYEYIIYLSDQFNNRTAIESNINAYYNIY